MTTTRMSATRSGLVPVDQADIAADGVVAASALRASGLSPAAVRAQLDAGRWRRVGRAVVLHNGPPTAHQRRRIALVNAGPRALLTGYSALEELGLTGWACTAVDVLVPVGSRGHLVPGLPVVRHRAVRWSDVRTAPGRPLLHSAAGAAVVAAASERRARTACGLLTALVQQRLVGVEVLRSAVAARPNLRHRAPLLATLADVAMGADALSEIDFGLLCRSAGLPEPVRQSVRVEPDGRHRYLDAEWRRQDGRRVVAEVDGALHLQVRRWWDDQLRQNAIALTDTVVLRFPSVVVRERDPVVADQLRRAGISDAFRSSRPPQRITGTCARDT